MCVACISASYKKIQTISVWEFSSVSIWLDTCDNSRQSNFYRRRFKSLRPRRILKESNTKYATWNRFCGKISSTLINSSFLMKITLKNWAPNSKTNWPRKKRLENRRNDGSPPYLYQFIFIYINLNVFKHL